VLLTNAVVRAEPFHITVEPCTKLEPTTVSVTFDAPIETLLGDTDCTAGTGLLAGSVLLELFEPPHENKAKQSATL
jgi:hypothetical protein